MQAHSENIKYFSYHIILTVPIKLRKIRGVPKAHCQPEAAVQSVPGQNLFQTNRREI